MTNLYGEPEEYINSAFIRGYIDQSGINRFVNRELASSNFDGYISTETASVAVSELSPGQSLAIETSGSISFFPIIAIDRQDPDLYGASYTGEHTIYYLNGQELINLIYSSSSTQVTVGRQIWSDKNVGTSGWYLSQEGNAIFANVAVRGRIEASEGYIGDSETGWEIGANLLSNASVGFYAPSAFTGSDIAIFSGSPFTGRSTAPFRVNYAGQMNATGASISGALTATTLDVGGSNGIVYNGSAVTIGASVNILAPVTVNALQVGASPTLLRIANDVNGTNDGIYINANNYWYSDGQFGVGGSANNVVWTGSTLTVTGAIQATNITSSVGNIAGFTLANNQLSTASIVVSSSGGFRLGGNPAVFSVDQFGNLVATTASITGRINATSGSFSGDITASAGRFVGAVSVSSSGVIYAGSNFDSGQRTVLNASGLFGFHSNGLEAFALPVSGSPRLGTFTIIPTGIVSQSASNANMIYGDVDSSGNVTDGIVIRGFRSPSASIAIYNVVAGTATTYDAGNGFYIDENARFKLKGPTGSLAFDGTDLYIDGNINARSGNFTGSISAQQITASTGLVGGFLLSASSLTASNSTTTAVGITTGASAIFAGATSRTGGGARFWVSNNGILNASAAIIDGDSSINGTNIGNGGGNIASNLRVGQNALTSNTTGYENLALGDAALNKITTGFANVAIGASSMLNATLSFRNIAVGQNVMARGTATVFDNIVIGHGAFQNFGLLSLRNIVIGSSALYNISGGTPNNNVVIGVQAMGNAPGNGSNSTIAIGSSALRDSTGVAATIAIGQSALQLSTVGTNNIAIGYESLINSTTGKDNIAIGTYSGSAITTGSGNVFINYQGTTNTNDSFYLGVGGNHTGVTPRLAMQIDSSLNTTLYGNLTVDTNTLFVDATNNEVGIGTVSPASALHVVGNALITSNVNVDSGTFYVDSTNNRVGINTTTPNQSLAVVGTASVTGAVNFGSTLGVGGTTTISDSGGRVVVGVDAGGSLAIGLPGAGTNTPYIDFNSAATSGDFDVRMQSTGGAGSTATGRGTLAITASTVTISNFLNVDSGTLYVDSVNNEVGIGTTSPDGKLDIATDTDKDIIGGISTAPAITFRNGAGAWFHAGKPFSGDYFQISNGASPGVTNNLVVTSGGNVGIATTNPNQTLSVVGTASITSTLGIGGAITAGGNITMSQSNNFAPQLIIRNTNSLDNAGYLLFEKSFGASASAGGLDLGTIMFKGPDTGGTAQNSAYIVAETAAVSAANGTPSDLEFYTGNSTGTPTFGMALTSTQRLGIGTANPNQTLTVVGTASITSTLDVGSTTTITGLLQTNRNVTAGTVQGINVNSTNDYTTNWNAIGFDRNGVDLGFIRVASAVGAPTLVSASDYRLKKNIEDDSRDFIEIINGLRPVVFEWTDAEYGGKTHGFIAHEVQQYIPEAVGGTKDAVDENGNIIPQDLTQQPFVYYLVGAFKDSIKEIESLKAKVVELESRINQLGGSND